MERIIQNLIQGSDEWHQFRLEHFGASEAAAMLGVSRKVKRNELLQAKKTGIAKEFSDWVQRYILDYGHEVEAMARPIVERMIGETLYPTTFSMGELSASCDGITMSGEIAFEHKQWNAEYGAMVTAGEVPEEHMPQCQQVLLVTGAERLLFVVSDGTEENFASVWVYPDEAYQARIVAGWKQFAADLETYQPSAAPAQAAPAPVESLPSVFVSVTGSLAVSDNLQKFGDALRAFIDRTPRKPETDDEFAACEAAIKTLSKAEEALDAAESAALAQVACIDDMRTIKATLKDLARTNRLALEKLVKAEKEARRLAIVTRAQQDLAAFIAAQQAGLNVPLPTITGNFGEAIKGLKTMASIQNAVDTELSAAKIRTTEAAQKIAAALSTIEREGGSHDFLFSDKATLVQKDPEALALIIKSRIADHEAAQAQKLEQERARMQAEADAKAKAEADRVLEAERQKIRDEEKAAADKLANEQRAAAQAAATNDARELGAAVKELAAPNIPAQAPNIEPAPANIVDDGQRITLGQINSRLGVVSTTREGLSRLGFEPAGKDRAAILYRACDLRAICNAIAQHVLNVPDYVEQEAA